MEQKLDAVLQTVTSLKSDCDQRLALLADRLDKLERNSANVDTNCQYGDQAGSCLTRQLGSCSTTAALLGVQGVQSTTSGFCDVDTDPLLNKYKGVRGSFSSVRLPDDFYFGEKVSGIDSKSKDSAILLSLTAKYVETALKIVGALTDTLDASETVSVDEVRARTEDLGVTLVSCMCHMQEEHAGLVVAGTYGPKARAFFRNLGAGSSGIGNPRLVRHMETAANLASLAPNDEFSQRGRGHGFQGNFSHWSGRGRGQGRGGFQRNRFRDSTPGFQPVSVPIERDDQQ